MPDTQAPTAPTIAVCIRQRYGNQPSCGGAGSEDILAALQDAARARGWAAETIEPVQCLAACAQGPNVRYIPGGAFHHGVEKSDLPAILDGFEAFCAEKGLTVPKAEPTAAPAGDAPIPGA